MDSLLANYASSDDEEEQHHHHHHHHHHHQPPQQPSPPPNPEPKSSSSSSSLFQSLPQPKQNQPSLLDDDSRTFPKPSSVFSALPQPKSHKSIPNFPSSEPNPKRVVQFRPPINPYSVKSIGEDDDDEEDEEEEKAKRRKRESESSSGASLAKSFLSFLPAPKNSVSLGVLPTAGTRRRAVVETEGPVSNSKPENSGSSAAIDNSGNVQSGMEQNDVNYEQYSSYGSHESGSDQNAANYGYFESYNSGFDQSGDGSSYGAYDGYGGYGQQYGNNWAEGSAAEVATEVPGASQSGFGMKGRRGRSEIPTEIVEVKQDELIKNRPREDQVKLTGIAFGPSYQPVSTKGKPSKLHKRKHQIGSLYFDMKQKEMELSERRSRGFLTKSETQAKYGW